MPTGYRGQYQQPSGRIAPSCSSRPAIGWARASGPRRRRHSANWKAVRALDASDLEQWLEASVAGQIWLAEQLGIPLAGLETLDQAWEQWTAASDPKMTAKMFEPAVSEHRSALTDWLAKPSDRPFVVAADSKDEALAFIYCLFGDGDVSAHHGDRVAVFDSAKQTLRTLALSPSPFIPIVSKRSGRTRACQHLSAVATASWYVPAMPLTENPTSRFDHCARRRSKRRSPTWASSEFDADRWARESGRSPTILRRRRSKIAAIRTPPWAGNREAARSLIPMVMAGAWHKESSADCEVLSALANADYQQVEETAHASSGAGRLPGLVRGPIPRRRIQD